MYIKPKAIHFGPSRNIEESEKLAAWKLESKYLISNMKTTFRFWALLLFAVSWEANFVLAQILNPIGIADAQNLTCGGCNGTVLVSETGTHIRSSNDGVNPSGSCQIDLKKPSSNVCQVRLDFVKFNLTGPNYSGDCVDDVMTISGAENVKQLRICGANDDQHLYLHYETCETVSVFLSLTNAAGSSFDIVPTFIECDTQNPLQAPDECTQYFPESSGEVRSFNFIQDTMSFIEGQINSQLYAVCVGSHPGASEIQWTPCSANLFCISGNYAGVGRTGNECVTDYVDIPGSPNGRYCGCGFPSVVTSRSQPFSLYVNFDDSEFRILITDPVTGCPFGFDCVDGYGDVIPIEWGLHCGSPEGAANGLACIPQLSLIDYIDSGNTGFCLRYLVI